MQIPDPEFSSVEMELRQWGTKLSRRIRKPTICICKNKGTDQLRGNPEADQRLCFRYTDSTIPFLLKFKISSFWLCSLVCVGPGLKPKLLVFSRAGSIFIYSVIQAYRFICQRTAFHPKLRAELNLKLSNITASLFPFLLF